MDPRHAVEDHSPPLQPSTSWLPSEARGRAVSNLHEGSWALASDCCHYGPSKCHRQPTWSTAAAVAQQLLSALTCCAFHSCSHSMSYVLSCVMAQCRLYKLYSFLTSKCKCKPSTPCVSM